MQNCLSKALLYYHPGTLSSEMSLAKSERWKQALRCNFAGGEIARRWKSPQIEQSSMLRAKFFHLVAVPEAVSIEVYTFFR